MLTATIQGQCVCVCVCVCVVAMQSGRLSGLKELNEIGIAPVPGARGMALVALLVPPVAGLARLFK